MFSDPDSSTAVNWWLRGRSAVKIAGTVAKWLLFRTVKVGVVDCSSQAFTGDLKSFFRTTCCSVQGLLVHDPTCQALCTASLA